MIKFKSLMSLLYNNDVRAFLFQVIAVVAVIFLSYQGINNMFTNIESRGIKTGFDFLSAEAGFDITDTLIEYSSSSSVLKVFFVALLNTLLVSFIGIILASIIGLLIGVARLSNNWLVAKFATSYIELFRNIPILLQILFWYNIFLNVLPSTRNSLQFFDNVFVNIRGFYMPKPVVEDGFVWVVFALLIAFVIAFFIRSYFKKKQDETGKQYHIFWYSLLVIILLPIIVYLSLGLNTNFDNPTLSGFNFEGGMFLSPEFLALTFSLSIYTATYIAEAIRSGIEAVNTGQKEAAKAMGLSQGQALKLVILPQALRVAIPPIINQYLNLIKNSSLAAAISYPELVSVFTGTVLNNIGQAVEIILITMGIYLLISIVVSLVLNSVNHKMRIKER